MRSRSRNASSSSLTRRLLAFAITAALLLGVTAVAAEAKTKRAGQVQTTTTTVATAPSYLHQKTETFGTRTWWQAWGLQSAPWHTTLVTEAGNQFLRVGYAAGSHDGTAFKWKTGDADSARIRYRLRLSDNWTMPDGKLPGFGNPTYDDNRACSGGCGLAAANGITSWSARGHLNGRNVLGSYLYTPGRSTWSIDWYGAPIVPGRWYTIDYWVTMNTPGRADGVIHAAIDGKEVANWTDLTFRLVPTLHVGTAWFDFYYGGPQVPPQNMWIDIDDLAIDY